MKQWEKLTQEEKNEIISKAYEWRKNNIEHVNRAKMGFFSVAEPIETYITGWPPEPSRFDSPQLWRGQHWVWFDRGGE